MKPEEVVTLEDMKKYIRYITKQKRPDISDTDTERIIETITRTVKTPSGVAAFMEGFLK